MEVLVLDGKNYVKASKAAKDLGYATDYVGQLCRSGQVDAHLIGRTWYVNQEELATHRTEKKRMSREKARQYAKKSIAEVREKNTKTRNHYENIAIRYEEDDEPLIPETRRIQIQSAIKSPKIHVEEHGDEKTIINKGEKVQMSGNIPIVDVTDGEIDSETIILESRPIRNSASKVEKQGAIVQQVIDAPEVTPKKINFVDRLDISPTNNQVEGEVLLNTPRVSIEEQNSGVYKYLVPLFILLITSLATLLVSSVTTYTFSNEGSVDITTSFRTSYTDTISIIKQKI